VNKLEEELIEY